MAIAATLPIKALLEINAALSSLEGTQTVVKNDVEKTEKVVIIPYQFSGKARWNIAKNTTLLKRIAEDFGKARDAVINEVSKGTGRVEPTDETVVKDFNVKINDILNTEESTKGLLSLTVADLNLDVNQISVAVLSALEPIVTE